MEGLKVIDYSVPDFVPDAALVKEFKIEITDGDGYPIRNKRFMYSVDGKEERLAVTDESGVLSGESIGMPEKVKLSIV